MSLTAAVAAVAAAVVVIRAVTTPTPPAPQPPGHTVPLSSLGTLGLAPSAGAMGAENVPIPQVPALAPRAATGQTVDGISCQSSEQTLFHVHTHLTVFVDGQQEQVPAGIGIVDPQATGSGNDSFIDSGSCFYWLHTHAADGIIHIESPVQRTFTLGDFFDEWGEPLSSTRVGPARGTVTALSNSGSGWVVYQGDPRNIPLGSHVQVQLEGDTALVAPHTISWLNTGL